MGAKLKPGPPTSDPAVASFLSGSVEAGQSGPLRALWHAGHGDWNAAHEEAQAGEDPESCWVHAMVHREEGDAANATYWYRRAGKPVSRASVAEEALEILTALLPPPL